MQRKDPLTGEVFIPQRTNQRFASRHNQIRFNNLKAGEKRKAKANINRKLDKNRTVLKNILGNKQETEKSVDFLLGAGFDFFCVTQNRVKDGKTYSSVYEFGIRKSGEHSIQIFRNDS